MTREAGRISKRWGVDVKGVKISHMSSPSHPLAECRGLQGPRGGQSNEVWGAWSLDDNMKSRSSLPTRTVMRSRCSYTGLGLWDLGIFFFFFKVTVGVPWLTQILLLFERCQHLILKDLANCNCCYTHECYSLLMTHSLKEYFHLDYLDFSTIYSNATEYCFKNDLSWDLCFLELGLKIMLNY